MSPARVQHALGTCTNHGLKPQVAVMPLGASLGSGSPCGCDSAPLGSTWVNSDGSICNCNCDIDPVMPQALPADCSSWCQNDSENCPNLKVVPAPGGCINYCSAKSAPVSPTPRPSNPSGPSNTNNGGSQWWSNWVTHGTSNVNPSGPVSPPSGPVSPSGPVNACTSGACSLNVPCDNPVPVMHGNGCLCIGKAACFPDTGGYWHKF